MSGYLDNGRWREGWYDTAATKGEFVRSRAAFRDWISADGAAGFPAAAGRYHLYVSLACPWAHRTLIVRALKKLEDAVAVSVVEPVMSDQGWAFSAALPDRANGFDHLHQLYTAARPDYSGRVTVPVLWDTTTGTIVNNESAEIIRMFNSEFDAFGDASVDLYPAPLRAEIDEINDFVYENINNGVYRCGFASTQDAYQAAFDRLFAALDRIEARLAERDWLVGAAPTEADWRLFTTLVRFDAVYYGHFKCNLDRIDDFPRLARYLRRLYAVPGVAATVDIDHIKRHYYMSHPQLNPSRIVPAGPRLDFSARR
jgi:putative glutathione S-transferase